MTSGAASPPPQPVTEHDDDSTRLDVGPSWVGLTPDEKSRAIADWARALDNARDRHGIPVDPVEMFGAASAGAIRLSEVQPEAIEWVWLGRLARGKITLIDGDPGLGKSLLSLDIAARLTTGTAWPDGQPCLTRGSVLLLGAEDGLADTVRPRLDAAGADVNQAYALPTIGMAGSEHQPSIPDDIPAIEAELVATGAVLLVIDPLMAYLGGTVNSHRDQDVRRALAPLAAVADRLSVAVLVIRHLNKSSGGPAIYRGGGSIGLAGAARIVLAVGADPEDDSRRILAPVKANLSAPSPSLAYRLVEAPGAVRIDWLGTSDVTAAQMFALPVDEEERSALDDAVTFLHDRLAGGQVDAATIKADAHRAGVAERTLRRARDRLKVKPRKLGMSGPWVWSLPAPNYEDVQPSREVARPKVMGTLPSPWTPSADGTVASVASVASPGVGLPLDWLAADDARRVAQMAAGKARRLEAQSRAQSR